MVIYNEMEKYLRKELSDDEMVVLRACLVPVVNRMINHESLSSDNNENIDFSFDYDKMLDYLNFHEDYMLHCASKDMIKKLFKSLIDKCVLGKWKTGDKIGYMINPYILINYQVIVTRFRPDVALFQKTKWEKYNEKIWNEVIMMYY